jgi:hypothetical protein
MHPSEQQLASFAGGELPLLDRLRTARHVARCAACERILESYESARAQLRNGLDELPENLNWNRLASEMTGNIRVGLAAGECVAPVIQKGERLGWRAAIVLASATLLITTAWWLNIPRSNFHPGIALESNSSGIELKQNGGALTLLNTRAAPGSPVISSSSPGQLRTRYVDAETNQVTINNVYAQ